MLPRGTMVRALAGVALASATWGRGGLAAGEAKGAPPKPALEAEAKRDDLRPDLMNFKGLLAGEIVSVTDTEVVLKVRSVTIVEGSQAANPARLLGREVPVQFATEKEEGGQPRPVPWLVETVKAAAKMGGLGVLAMPNEMVITNVGGAGQGGVAATTVVVGGHVNVGGDAAGGKAHRIERKLTIGGPDGAQIEVAIPPEALAAGGADEKARKQPPRVLLRVRGDGKGTLFADRAVPGAQAGYEWDSVPKVRLLVGPQPPPAAPPARKGNEADF